MFATSSSCTSQGRANLVTPRLKRKRSVSCSSGSSQDAPVSTKLRMQPAVDGATCATESCLAVGSPSSAVPAAGSGAATSRTLNTAKLRETLEAHLSLEVLLKHNELRLIDQEIAKCQIALEQLRRCAEIPFPGSNATGVSQAVSDGTGLAVLPPGNGPAPQSPAPWGVTDGAYTRHYAKWLIPDPRFDGGTADSGQILPGAVPVQEGRATRANSGDSAGRLRRCSSGVKLQSLPNGYPVPKERAGPMIIRRKLDGVLVKLICLDCQRDNFSSTQGFINHCRIAHNRNFASHDAAAVASGEPVSADESSFTAGNTAASTASGYVHPLVRSAHAIESSSNISRSQVTSGSPVTPQKTHNVGEPVVETLHFLASSQHEKPSSLTTNRISSHRFIASSDTPHLSSLMQVKGAGMDLGQLIGDVKTHVDFDDYPSEEDQSDNDEQPSADVNGGQPGDIHVGRQPVRMIAVRPMSQQASQLPVPSGRKGHGKIHDKPIPLRAVSPTQAGSYMSPYRMLSGQTDGTQETDIVDAQANFSPNMMELNQAPSLVSDDGDDYEAAMDSESPTPASSDAGDHQDLGHISVEDDEGAATTAATDPKASPELASSHHSGLTRRLRKESIKDGKLLSHTVEHLTAGEDRRHVNFSCPESPTKDERNNRLPNRQ